MSPRNVPGGRAARPAREKVRRGGSPRAAQPLPAVSAPLLAGLGLVLAVLAGLGVTFLLTTPDFWQHLLVGKAIFALGRVPQEHLWTWPSYGQREVLPSWGFTGLLWPFWAAGGAAGLEAWRVLTTLAAFGVSWWTARRLGARGVTPLVVIAACVLAYRVRSQVRPETLVAVLLALEIAVLERRRVSGGGAIALVAIACAWANVHLSYWIGLALIGIHAMAARERRDAGSAGAAPNMLARIDGAGTWVVLAVAIAVSFANPFGWRALAQPFEYFFVWRNEPVYRTISELQPLWQTWRSEMRSGLPILVLAWPLLIAVRAAMRRFDAVEAWTALLFTALAIFNSRFAGFLAVAMAPYLARDLSERAGAMRWPAFLRPAAARAALALALFAVLAGVGAADRRMRFGVGWVPTLYPTAACDFIAAHDVRGRMFNPYYFGGYVAWRFWPDRARLPFMDIHQSGTRKDRELYALSFANPEKWSELDGERDFDLVLHSGHQEWVRGDRLLDTLDADSSWALVFRDDAAALYVRRARYAALADSFGYRTMPAGAQGFIRMGATIARDSVLRRSLRAELERAIASSSLDAWAHSSLANLDFLEGDHAAARHDLTAALAVEPTLIGAHRRLGYLEMSEGRWREAIAEFEAERKSASPIDDEYARMGEAWEKLGDRAKAAAAYRKHLDVHADDDEVREELRRVSAAP